MDFDNVWGDAPSSPPPPSESLAPKPRPHSSTVPIEFSSFDDDDFGTGFEVPPASGLNDDVVAPDGDDDDFGDFGDFGDAAVAEPFDDQDMGDFNDVAFQDESQFESAASLPPDPGPSSWTPLHLRPMPSPGDLARDVEALLAPVYGHVDPESVMTSDPIRQIEGIGQILTTPSSRSLYETLFNSSNPPSMRPPNWTRSRIRRQHLISLGIPINLDEVLPAQPASKAMPLMHISTGAASRPMSAPPGPRNGHTAVGRTRESQSRAQTPRGSPERGPASARTPRATAQSTLHLGPKPELDRERVTTALALDPDRLSLMPVSTLQAHLDSLRGLTTTTQELLSHLLQEREALQQDSETYNALIAELVSEAQQQKMGGRKKPVKRGTTGA